MTNNLPIGSLLSPDDAPAALGPLVTTVSGIVALTERVLWRLVVLKLVATSDERRFIDAAAADVDAAAAELADAEAARTEQVLRLSHSWGVPTAELTLTAIADRAPEGVAIALRVHRGRLHALAAEVEATSADVKRAVGVNLRNLNAVLAGVNGGAGTYTSDGRADIGNTRPRVQRAL
jgi:hypothetical protein